MCMEEPAGSTVQDNWGTGDNLWHQYLSNELGSIVISIDNRGTRVPWPRFQKDHLPADRFNGGR
ncbi:MAG: hypothetical protein IPL84_00635 [Chitinophagaceae bacterium]|nr:hypothetical protein [Chitinophagaceae bacterium]